MNPQQIPDEKKEDADIGVQGLFNEIYNLALAGDEAGLEHLIIKEDKCIEVRWYHSHYFHTPASLLAAQGQDAAVALLFKVESGTIDSILYGYALAANTNKVEEYLKLKGSINAALCGYIARLDPVERSHISSQFDPEEKLALVTDVNDMRNFGFHYLVEDLLNRGASLNVALMAYGKANASLLIVDDLVSRGASKYYAIYGYAQRGEDKTVNKLIGYQKLLLAQEKEIAYRYALGKHVSMVKTILNTSEKIIVFVRSVAKGYAQSDMPLHDTFPGITGMDHDIGKGYMVAGRPRCFEKYAGTLRFYDFAEIFTQSGNMRYADKKFPTLPLPGRNLHHVEKFIKKIHQGLIDPMNANAKTLEIFSI